MKKHRLAARAMARESYIEAGGDVAAAKKIFRAKLKGYGSILTMLTIGAIMLQIAYTLFKFWQDTRVAIPPEEPASDEPVSY